MQLGAVFPQNETTADPTALRDYVQAVEGLGYDHVALYDHVLGAHPDRPDQLKGPYTHEDAFHEVLVTLGYMAAVTTRLELVTEILILPQRQAVLVAKQAAQVDVLSGGRLRLGVGLGWNHVEYEALGEDFHTRGRRIEEQIEVMRRLWTEPLVDFHGEFHDISNAGLLPLPSRSIPVWFGATAEAAKRRMARVGDGWMMNMGTESDPVAALEQVRGFVDEAGRDGATFPVDVRISLRTGVDKAVGFTSDWVGRGVSHITAMTAGAGLAWPGGHLDRLREYKAALDRG